MAISTATIENVVKYILPSVQAHQKHHGASNGRQQPFVLGLSGMQGSGKSTWAQGLARTLRAQHNFKVVVLSLDDLYHTHDKLVEIRQANQGNELFRNRGQPGTHDEVLAEHFFAALFAGHAVAVPSFDKSRYNGEGDRAPESEWEHISVDLPVDILIFEGWCVGFQALTADELTVKWNASLSANADSSADGLSITEMRHHPLEHLRVVNDHLRRYNDTFMGPSRFNYFIHLDTSNLRNVYHWRIEQEHALRAAKGTGQTDEQVIAFVKVYMPAYELYLERLRREALVPHSSDDTKSGRTQLRVSLDERRNVVSLQEL